MNVFNIIGPVMVGPSSSHTAGAVRIGRIAASLLGEAPAETTGIISRTAKLTNRLIATALSFAYF